MKAKTIIFMATMLAMTIQAQPQSAEVTTPLPKQGGVGGGSSLQQLKDSALQHNITLLNARRSVEIARQQRKEAFTNYFPNVSGTGLTFNANRGMAKMEVNPADMLTSEMGAALSQMLPAEALAALQSPMGMTMMKNGTLAGITALQPVFAGGQIVNGNRLARVGEEVSRLQLRLTEQEVEKQTEQYYWQLVSLEEKTKTVAAVEALLADIYKDVDVAVRAGVALRNDLLQVQLRQNDIESQKLKLQNGISVLQMVIAQYCGLKTLPQPLPVREGSDYSQGEKLAEELSTPLPHREGAGVGLLPEYQLLQKQVEAASLQRKMEVGKNLPSLAVGAGYNYHNLLDNNRTFGMVFATVSVPISDWWGGSHAVKRRRLQQQQAEDQLRDGSEQLTIRMQKAWNDVVEARQQLQLTQRSIEQAEENLRLQRDYYRAGTATMSSLLEAQMLYQQTLDRHTDAYADLQNKLLEYRQATGQ